MAKANTPRNDKPKLSAVEQEATAMLEDAENIDNVFDVIEELTSIEERLPASSPLRAEWDPFYASCMETIVGSAGD
jgi:hypothetical protein